MNRFSALVLHAHVPWVRHPETPRCLEEDWYFEAVAECYLPLLEMLHRVRDEGIPFRLAMTLSPPLCAMMRDELMQKRTRKYLERGKNLAAAEIERGTDSDRRRLADWYLKRFEKLEALFNDRWNSDLIAAFADLKDSGHLDILGCSATHGLLPLLHKVPETIRAQIEVGCQHHEQCFGERPRGFWLPECAYTSAVEPALKAAGIEWSLLEEHGILFSKNPPASGVHHPIRSRQGNVFFGRDSDSSRQIWSAESGYPGDPRYREFYRDLGLEAPIDDLRDYLGGSDLRRFTGLKFHRITDREGGGPSGEAAKQIYTPEQATRAVAEHALQFVESRAAQLSAIEYDGVATPIIVSAFDAELFGHWWFEGVEFLEKVIRHTAARDDFQLVSPGDHLAAGHPVEDAEPVTSSWGEGGYFETWLSEENAWIYPHLHRRAQQLKLATGALQRNADSVPDEVVDHRRRCLAQMARELLLAQSSDWAFLMRNGDATPYARKRTEDHIDHFDSLWAAHATPTDPESLAILTKLEKQNPIFPNLPWDIFA
jgi:1,4-alpha-glucan branching enzyme